MWIKTPSRPTNKAGLQSLYSAHVCVKSSIMHLGTQHGMLSVFLEWLCFINSNHSILEISLLSRRGPAQPRCSWPFVRAAASGAHCCGWAGTAQGFIAEDRQGMVCRDHDSVVDDDDGVADVDDVYLADRV